MYMMQLAISLREKANSFPPDTVLDFTSAAVLGSTLKMTKTGKNLCAKNQGLQSAGGGGGGGSRDKFLLSHSAT